MNITIIAYKPNSEDTCMGCHMGSYGSDFQMFEPDTVEEAAWTLARMNMYDRQYGEAEYECTILFNGRKPDWENDEEMATLNALREQTLTHAAEIEAHREAERKKKDASDRAARIREQEERERAEYQRLHQKFNPPME